MTTGLSHLDGVTVIDLTQALSGPFCTVMLADLGADVIKVENPARGDDARHWGPPFVGEDSAYFMSVNRNKRSVALNLKDPVDLAALHALIDDADVLVENWRPGTALRLGLGAEALRARNPRLVYCSISGFGQDQGSRSGYDQILQGTSGVMAMTGPVGEPTKWGVPAGDVAAGMFAATAIVSALYERQRTGQGQVIDIAMQDSLITLLTHQAARYLNTGVVPPSDHNNHSTIAPYGTFTVRDGFINVCVGNDAQFLRMSHALDRPDLPTDPRYLTNGLRVANKDVLISELDAIFATRTAADAIATLELAGVPVGPVRDIGEVLDDPETAERGMVLQFDRDDAVAVRVVNTPWKFDSVAPAVRRPPPHVGEHNDEVLGPLLGLAAE